MPKTPKSNRDSELLFKKVQEELPGCHIPQEWKEIFRPGIYNNTYFSHARNMLKDLLSQSPLPAKITREKVDHYLSTSLPEASRPNRRTALRNILPSLFESQRDLHEQVNSPVSEEASSQGAASRSPKEQTEDSSDQSSDVENDRREIQINYDEAGSDLQKLQDGPADAWIAALPLRLNPPGRSDPHFGISLTSEESGFCAVPAHSIVTDGDTEFYSRLTDHSIAVEHNSGDRATRPLKCEATYDPIGKIEVRERGGR